MTLKMRFPFVLILLLDIPHLKGQQRIEELQQHILLRLSFPPFYNNYNKSCCKLYPGGCYKLLDSAGYTCDFLRGRVNKTEKDGWIEFEISNVQLVDAGYYRCGVLGAQTQIYSDYYFEVFEVPDHHRQFDPPLTVTIQTPNSSTALPEPTEPTLSQNHTDKSRAPWSFAMPLAVIVSITVMIFVSAVIGAVCVRVKTKCKQSDIYGETLCESLKHEAPETNSIVYTTVDFRAHQEPEEVYANLRVHKTRAGVPDMECAGIVEYSTLAIQL